MFARQQQRARGGFIVCVPSVHGPWSHRFWTADFETFEAFESMSPRLDAVYHWLARVRWPMPPLIFPGAVRSYSRADVLAKYGAVLSR